MKTIEQFANVSVLCVGDVMLDRFVAGSVHRVSPESPVPVLSIGETRVFVGGAANVVRNIAALGSRGTLVGVVGPDRVGAELVESLAGIDGVTSALMTVPGRPTTEKMRFVAQGQQLLRVDQEDISPLSPDDEERLLALIASHLDGHQVMVLSDYAKGVLTPAVVRGAIALARLRHMPVIVDPKSADMSRYGGATIVTPNAKEVHAATGLDPTEDDAVAERAGERILAESGIESILVTRAHRGMTLVSRTAPSVHLRAHAREVFDVVGAGDTVVATLAVALGLDETLADAALMANVAAGIVVGKRGTATVSRRELAQRMRLAVADALAPVRGKLMNVTEALEQAAAWRLEGHEVAWIDAGDDGLDASHVTRVHDARSLCDRLIVGLRSSASPSEAVGQDPRAFLLAAWTAVDAVVLVGDQDAADLDRQVGPVSLHADAESATPMLE